MARSRNIKPGFFQNDELGGLDPLSRLAFIGMWTVADFKGCIEFRPKMLKIQILPYDDCDIELIANNLEKAGFIHYYLVQGKRYLKIINFEKHQNPHKNERESGSEIPDVPEYENKNNELDCYGTKPDLIGTTRADSLKLIPDSLIPDSNNSTPIGVLVISKTDDCPHLEILKIYSEILPELPQPRIWEGQRKKNLSSRWKWVLQDLKKRNLPNGSAEGIDFFRRMFEYIGKSDLLMGRVNSWSTDLGWIVKAENFAKIIQGNYDNKAKA